MSMIPRKTSLSIVYLFCMVFLKNFFSVEATSTKKKIRGKKIASSTKTPRGLDKQSDKGSGKSSKDENWCEDSDGAFVRSIACRMKNLIPDNTNQDLNFDLLLDEASSKVKVLTETRNSSSLKSNVHLSDEYTTEGDIDLEDVAPETKEEGEVENFEENETDVTTTPEIIGDSNGFSIDIDLNDLDGDGVLLVEVEDEGF